MVERQRSALFPVGSVALIVMVMVAGVVGWWWVRVTEPQAVRSFVSPDSRYAVIVWRRPDPGARFPNIGHDPSGWVELRDVTGRILGQQDVPTVTVVETVRWAPTSVEVDGVTRWPLAEGAGP